MNISIFSVFELTRPLFSAPDSSATVNAGGSEATSLALAPVTSSQQGQYGGPSYQVLDVGKGLLFNALLVCSAITIGVFAVRALVDRMHISLDEKPGSDSFFSQLQELCEGDLFSV